MVLSSVGERLAGMDRVAPSVARQSNLRYGSLPLLTKPYQAAPHQTAPLPSNMNFPEILYHVLSSQEHEHLIAWFPNGHGFVVHDEQGFADTALPKYFDCAKFTSFTRLLKRWNFERIPWGPGIDAYYHKNLVRGRLDLVQKMRYRAGGQFEEGKKKSKDGKDGGEEKKDNENSKEQSSKEADNKVHGKSPCPSKCLPAEVVSQNTVTRNLTNPQDPPLMLRKSPQGIRNAATSNSFTAIGPLRNHPGTINAGNPKSSMPWPDNSDAQLLMEVQQELMLARTTCKQITNGMLPGYAGGPFASTPVARLPGHTATAERMKNDDHAKLSLETERVRMLGLSIFRQHVANINSENEELKNIAMHDILSKMAPPIAQSSGQFPPRSTSYTGYGGSIRLQGENQQSLPVGSNPFAVSLHDKAQRNVRAAHYDSGKCAVMMGKEEEEEFAEYLYLKRCGF